MNLTELKLTALLHDIGKLECWAWEKPWSHHIYYTRRLLQDTFGEELAFHAMRHHTGPSYSPADHPQSDLERVVAISDNISSGADRSLRPETEVRGGGPRPKPPVILSHVLSDGSRIVWETDAKGLAVFKESFKESFTGATVSDETYRRLFSFLEGSLLTRVPADTRMPFNDTSLWQHAKLTAAIASCVWRDGGFRGERPEAYRFALISGDADKVSTYVNQASRLPDLRAGSQRITDATSEAGKAVAESLGPECLIYAGGGSVLALAPTGQASDVKRRVAEAFQARTGQVTMTVTSVERDGREVQKSFGKVWRDARKEMRGQKLRRSEAAPEPLEAPLLPCDICHIREGVHKDEERILNIDASPRPEALCHECWRRRQEGKGAWLDDLRDANNLVAVVKADGDDIGEALGGGKIERRGKSMAPSRLSTLSSLIHQVCRETLASIVKEDGGECIFAGGDDVLAVLPGVQGLGTARRLAEAFKEKMAGECTMSCGVAIFHYRLPIYAGLEAAEALLKEVAKRSEGKDSLAFKVIGGGTFTREELREGTRPYKWGEVDALLEVVDFLEESRMPIGQLRRLAWASKRDPGEAEVLLKYQMGRGVLPWEIGERLLSHQALGLLSDAFQVYNLTRRRGGGEAG